MVAVCQEKVNQYGINRDKHRMKNVRKEGKEFFHFFEPKEISQKAKVVLIR